MKKLANWLSHVSFLITFVTFLSYAILAFLVSDGLYSGSMIGLIAFLFVMPIYNLYGNTRYDIEKPLYHLIFIFFSCFIFYYVVEGLTVYLNLSANETSLFVSHSILRIWITLLLMLLAPFLFPKKKVSRTRPISIRVILSLSLLIFVVPRLITVGFLPFLGWEGLLFFLLVILWLLGPERFTTKLEILYWTVIFLCAYFGDPISAVLIFHYWYQVKHLVPHDYNI